MYSEQLGHFTSVGAVAFQTLERLLFFLALPVLLAGTAISNSSLLYKQVSSLINKQIRQSRQSGIDLFFTFAFFIIQVLAAALTESLAVLFAKHLYRQEKLYLLLFSRQIYGQTHFCLSIAVFHLQKQSQSDTPRQKFRLSVVFFLL